MSGFNLVKLLDPIQMTISGTFNPLGAYDNATNYAVGDQVDYQGSSYIMYNDAAAGTLPTDTSHWGLIASKGNPGDQGDPGTTDYNELDNLPTLGTAAATDIGDYATAAQGALADTALQAADIADFETTSQLNTRDTNNRARANHTGTQAISTVTDLQTELDSKLEDVDIADINATGTPGGTTYLRGDGTWSTPAGGGGAVDSVNTQTGDVVLDADDIDDTSTTNKFTTAGDISKLAGIESGADVTDATNVGAAGAFMKSVDDTDDITVGATNKFATAAEKTKLGHITVTQAVDLDTMESDIASKVTGAASSTDNAAARFDSTTGKIVQNSNVLINDEGSVTLPGVASPAYTQGKLVYDTDEEALTFYNNDANVALQIGQENWIRVRNDTGSTIANGAAVYISGTHASGLPQISLARANNATTTVCQGLATESIANGAIGYVCSIGLVRNIDTSAFTAGQIVYVSSATAGLLTATAPSAPNYRYRVGIITRSHATQGRIHVTPSTAALGNGTANQLFGINNAGTAQEVKTLQGTANDVTVTHGANTITLATGTNIYKAGGTDVPIADGGTGASSASAARTNLAVPEASGFAKITVGTSTPSSPATGDLWVDTN